MSHENTLRRALRTSANRHWLARLVVSTWALCIALFAFLDPASSVGRAMAAAGEMAYILMAVLGVLALGAMTDSAIHDFFPGELQQLLMVHRHAATMAIVLAIEGAALALKTKAALLAGPFLLLSLFCALLTYLDLRARAKECR